MTDEEFELDPDFTQKEHEEFEKLERENPYKEVFEEKVRVPTRTVSGEDGRYDSLFLLIFIIIMAVFLVVIVTRMSA